MAAIKATRGRDEKRDRQGGRPLRSSRGPRTRRYLWRRRETRTDFGRFQGTQQAHLRRALPDDDLRARHRRPQGARAAARLPARRRQGPSAACRFPAPARGFARAHRRADPCGQPRRGAGREEGRHGQPRAPHHRVARPGRQHPRGDRGRPHRHGFPRRRPHRRPQAAGGLPAHGHQGQRDDRHHRAAEHAAGRGEGRGRGRRRAGRRAAARQGRRARQGRAGRRRGAEGRRARQARGARSNAPPQGRPRCAGGRARSS